MSTITKIKDINLKSLNNAEYTQFLSNTEGLLVQATSEKLKIAEELLNAFKANVKKLTDISQQSKVSPETEELTKLDKQRDDLLVYLLSAFRTERKTPIESRKTAAVQLYNFTKTCIGAQSLPNRQETQVVEGLITDLNKTENKAHIATLGLAEVVEQLGNINQKYKKMTADRAESQILNTLESAKKIRKEADVQYDELITRAFVASVAFPTPETKAFVNSVNKLIEDTKIAYKQRVGHIKKAEKGKESAPKSEL